MNKIKDQLCIEELVLYQVYDHVNNHFYNETTSNVWNQVQDQTIDLINNQIRNHLYIQLCDQVSNIIGDQIKEQTQDIDLDMF